MAAASGFLTRHPPMRLVVAVTLLLALAALPGASTEARVAGWQTTPLSADPAVPLPLVTIASGDSAIAIGGAEVVWIVQSDPAADIAGVDVAGGALEFVFARDSITKMHGEHGAFSGNLPPSRGRRLASGEVAPLAGTATGPDLTVRIALIPAAALPVALPPGVIASELFSAPGAGFLHTELRQGVLAPGHRATFTSDEAPALLLAIDDPLQVERQHDAPVALTRGQVTLLTTSATIRNMGSGTAAFIVTRIEPRPRDPSQVTSRHVTGGGERDAELDEAWQRNGCHLNPGNPSCMTVGLAAACAIDASAPGCDVDSDADSCFDVAEVRAALDPFDPADCVGSADGRPLLNCLFFTGNLACDGSHSASGDTVCGAPVDSREGPLPDEPSGCDHAVSFPSVDCGLVTRDPTCDGFAPHSG